MLTNVYLLAKIGADTAENEQHFAEIMPIGRRVAEQEGENGREDGRDKCGDEGDAAAAHFALRGLRLGIGGSKPCLLCFLPRASSAKEGRRGAPGEEREAAERHLRPGRRGARPTILRELCSPAFPGSDYAC